MIEGGRSWMIVRETQKALNKAMKVPVGSAEWSAILKGIVRLVEVDTIEDEALMSLVPRTRDELDSLLRESLAICRRQSRSAD